MRLRRRGRLDHAPSARALLFAVAIALFTLALVSPLDAAGEEYLLSAHMLQHVVIGDLAPALALVALRGPVTFFLLPPVALRPFAKLGALRAALRFLLRPKASLALWGVVVAAWHVPAAYDAVLSRPALHDLEHATFVLAGFLVWSQLVDPARRGELRVGGRILYAVVLFACGQVLADVLLFSFHLAGFYDLALRNPWLLNLEHAALIAIGLLFWWPVLSDAPRAVGVGLKLGYLWRPHSSSRRSSASL